MTDVLIRRREGTQTEKGDVKMGDQIRVLSMQEAPTTAGNHEKLRVSFHQFISHFLLGLINEHT